MNRDGLANKLDALAAQLRAAGHAEAASELAQRAVEVRAAVASWPGDLLTPAQAAEALGVRSVKTIKRWVRDGQIEGFPIAGRVFVLRRSVERLKDAASLKQQQAFKHGLADALAPFDATAEEVAELTAGAPRYRTPWRTNATTSV
jgi:hypothetical protein